jgi:hypothetical protein
MGDMEIPDELIDQLLGKGRLSSRSASPSTATATASASGSKRPRAPVSGRAC